MGILEVVTVVTMFVVNTYPIAIAVGAVGHAMTASKWPKVQRVGMVLEGIGMDWRRVAEAFRKDPGK